MKPKPQKPKPTFPPDDIRAIAVIKYLSTPGMTPKSLRRYLCRNYKDAKIPTYSELLRLIKIVNARIEYRPPIFPPVIDNGRQFNWKKSSYTEAQQ